jgi:hypothetical protein
MAHAIAFQLDELKAEGLDATLASTSSLCVEILTRLCRTRWRSSGT